VIKIAALLGISESGALNLSNWVESYLFCDGLTKAAGESVILGHLQDWSFVEEFVPLQMIQVLEIEPKIRITYVYNFENLTYYFCTQALSQATKEYLCMEKMYCPFYDTLLFIFNNPAPISLQAEASFCTQLKTLPGLQDFLGKFNHIFKIKYLYMTAVTFNHLH